MHFLRRYVPWIYTCTALEDVLSLPGMYSSLHMSAYFKSTPVVLRLICTCVWTTDRLVLSCFFVITDFLALNRTVVIKC